jgi:hypothetical protein
MRVMILAKTTPETENASPNPEGAQEMGRAMGRFHEDLTDARVLLASGRLEPSTKAARLRFEREKRRVIDGPFVESKEIVAGYWIWQVGSLDEAVDWLNRAPFGEGTELEIRPIVEGDMLGG